MPCARLSPAAVALCLFLAGCGEAATTPPNLLLVTLDTVRADRVSHLGGRPGVTPALDALAARGVTFTEAWAPRGQTWPALASLWTGRSPLSHGVRENGFALAPSVTTVADLARHAGRRTGAFLSNACEAWGADRFETLRCSQAPGELEGDQSRLQHAWDRRSVDRALAWLDGSDAPFVAWVHLYDAHKPWPTVDGLRERWLDPAYTGPWRAAPGEVASGHRMPFHDRVDAAALAGRAPEGEDLAAVLAYYDAGLSSVDRELQRLLDGLDARGLSENTLVVVTADHGEELFDTNAYPYHGAGLSRSVLRVPLVFAWAVRDDKRGAGELARGRVVEMPVELADVAPTLLELLDLPRTPGLEAESFVGWLRPEAAPPAAGDRFCELVELDLADTPPRIEGELFALAPRECWRERRESCQLHRFGRGSHDHAQSTTGERP